MIPPDDNLQFRLVEADQAISDFVYCFSAFHNLAAIEEGIIIPNGKIDLVLSFNDEGQFHISLLGLETEPKMTPKQTFTKFFSISFEPLAVEYILRTEVAGLLNSGKKMPDNFWGFTAEDLFDFEAFCLKASRVITSLIPNEVDQRKQLLFAELRMANGEVKVGEIAEKLGWNSRQINQYFNRFLGVSLKTYCRILRFQSSLRHIWEGELYPQLSYTDQSHFIKEVKKLSGVSPKELSRNENSRFLQFLVYDKE